MKDIVIKEDSIEAVVKVNSTITEFDEPYDKVYFENRCKNAVKLILVAYVDNKPAGYMVSYDRNNDGSFYCWMTGVNPLFRRLGILKKMMEYLDNWAKEHGYNKIRIKTRNNRREMLAYLIKNGFNLIEVEPRPLIKDNRVIFEKNIE
jgi:ribosomal protein S18 acetylase RimI-like enzyme